MGERLFDKVPAAPSDLTPIEWVAVFLVVAFVVMAILVVTRVPRAIRDSSATQTTAQDAVGTKITNAIDRLADEIRGDRRAQDLRANAALDQLNRKLDGIAATAARDRAAIRREIVRLECYTPEQEDDDDVPKQRGRSPGRLP